MLIDLTTYIEDICRDVWLAVITVRLARADSYVVVSWRRSRWGDKIV